MSKTYNLGKIPCRDQGGKIIKVMDPVHNFIDISEYPVISQLIDTPYFQRLRRLNQLGLASTVYPNATHTRFAHCIGVMHTFLVLFDSIAKRSKLQQSLVRLRPVGAVAALLHDIGHGPFSHVSEQFLEDGTFDHESLTQQIIRKTAIANILNDNNIDPELVCDILKHQVPRKMRFMSQLISSQLDADRIDYLMRDALFTGVTYGKIDLHRIANTLSIWNDDSPSKSLKGTVVVSHKGIEAVEDYLIGRYHMYKGVYYHKTVRCMEKILIKTFQRASELKKEWSKIANIHEHVTPENMLLLDDPIFYSAINKWNNSSDKILKDMSSRIINRNLLKVYQSKNDDAIKLGLNKISEIEKIYKRKDIALNYYWIDDSKLERGYEPYVATEQDNSHSSTSHIMVDTGSAGSTGLQEISLVSPLVRAISVEGPRITTIFVPGDILPEIKKLLNT